MAYYLLFIVALVGLDQFVKYWVSANIALGTSHSDRMLLEIVLQFTTSHGNTKN